MIFRKILNIITSKITGYDGSVVKINSQNFYNTNSDAMGVQSKPAQAVDNTSALVGAEFSPRIATGKDVATIVGVRSSPLIKGTGSVLTGDFNGFEADLTDNQQAGNTIGGDMAAIRAYLNMAAQTVTGDVMAVKVDDAGSTLQWDIFARVPNDSNMAKTTQTASTAAGWLKIKVGTTVKYIQLYDAVS